jgi:hypothetical protein
MNISNKTTHKLSGQDLFQGHNELNIEIETKIAKYIPAVKVQSTKRLMVKWAKEIKRAEMDRNQP